MADDWDRIREEFPALRGRTYLNTATFGQLPRRVTEAVARHFARRDEFLCADFMQWFDDADRIRASIGRLVHCGPEDIAFIPNASAGLSLLLGGLDWRAGDRIVTLDNEFPNHYYFPSWLRNRGVEFVETPFERFYDAVTPRTRVVALSTVSYATGFRAPLEQISRALRERGVLLYVDGTQSVGALDFDVRSIQPDLFAVHGYKWLLSPTGAGFMYVSPALRASLEPNVIGWRSHKDWRNHEHLHHGIPEFRAEAEKYEGGMLSFPLLYGMQASVEMMLEIGPQRIEARVLSLADGVRDILRRAGAALLSDTSPHFDSPVVAARFDATDGAVLARRLAERNVLVAARHGYLRVSPHFYNDENDLESLDEALRDLGYPSTACARTFGVKIQL